MTRSAVSTVRVQVVSTRATRLHCHSGPSAPLDTEAGEATLHDNAAAKAAQVTTAAATAAPLPDHSFDIMALVPVDPLGV